jgi:hypothetical protein
MMFISFKKKYMISATILFLIMTVYLLVSCGTKRAVQKETEAIRSTVSCDSSLHDAGRRVDQLPIPVQKWLQSSGVFDRGTIVAAHIMQDARMRMKPEDTVWRTARAEQFSTLETPAFIWTVKMKMNPLIYIFGRDKFEHGKGEMRMKINSLFTVVNELGEKIDEGSLQRFLGEMVWMPLLALSPYIEWEIIDEYSAKASMSYMGTRGSGTFYFNQHGDFIRFEALRYKGNEADAQRYLWVLTVDEYTSFEGVRVPSRMKATWKLPEGDWTWLELSIADIRYEVCEEW